MTKIFSIPEDVHYLNFAGISPLPQRTEKAGLEGVRLKSAPWAYSNSEKFFSDLDRLRAEFAKLINATAEEIALVPSATYGVTTAARNLKLGPQDEILVQAEEFPSIYYPLERRARETGAKLCTVKKTVGQTWTEAVAQSWNPRIKAVGVTPCHWTDGAILDLKEVRRLCDQNGAQMIVDGCQWVGAAPFDVHEIKPDHLVVPTYKWMLGPYQFGFHYIAPGFQNSIPLEEYWASRRGAENFINLTEYTREYQPGARRFDMSERSNLITVPMAMESVKILNELGPVQISEKIHHWTKALAQEAKKRNWIVPGDSERSPHFLGLRKKTGWPPGLNDVLLNSKIYVSFRGDCMRVAPHVESTSKDLDALLACLDPVSG